MDLINSTPLPAELRAGPLHGTDLRVAALLAKATFRIEKNGVLELETQEPVPLFPQDVETELGLIPRDDLVRQDETFEVILLGAAYAPVGRSVTSTTVSLAVGAVHHELLVVGDRFWVGSPRSLSMTPPRPFTRMPLTWSRAFGGTASVLIDHEAIVDVSEARNREGRGFDAAAAAQQLAASLKVPPGYPALVDANSLRPLPNLEDPYARITRPEDAPDPLCWATLTLDSGLHIQRALKGLDPEKLTPEELVGHEPFLYRAHPQWVLPMPPERAPMTLQNGTPDGLLRTALPSLRVVFDYTNDDRTATRDLVPQMLVLYPEEARLTITFRKPFTFPFREGTERCVRLRTEPGWYRSLQTSEVPR